MIKNKEEFNSAKKRTKIECICDYCGIKFFRTKNNIERSHNNLKKDSCEKKDCIQSKKKEIFNIKYGCDNPFQSAEVKQKIANSNLSKYGVPNVAQSKEVRIKQKKTCLSKYGAENTFQSEVIKEKIKKQNVSLYGVENSFQRKEVQEKHKKTIQKKYKVDHYSKTKEYKEKIIKTNLDRYGHEQSLSCPEIRDKIKKTNLEKYGVENPLASKEIQEKIIETSLKLFGTKNPMSNPKILRKMIDTCIQNHGKFPATNYGKTQNEIKEWLNGFGFNFNSDYTILKNKEIDLLDKNINLGIEYCGLYWHNELSPNPRGRSYHHNKYKKCLDNNIQLLTIFEDEWKFRKNQCKSHIKSILGITSKKIFARKCKVEEIGKKMAKTFFDSYHIQGSNRLGIIFFGLFFENELLGVMSLGRHNRQVNNEKIITLDRLCFKNEVQVIGGASKLFSRCLDWSKNNNYNKIISFSDNRWSLGNVYKKLEFDLEKEYGPDYSYVNVNKASHRLSKQSQRKNATNCPRDVTEHSWALERGLARIYDCGKKRWIYNI